jgi:hypothetical protein
VYVTAQGAESALSEECYRLWGKAVFVSGTAGGV